MNHLLNPFVSVIIPVFNDAERLEKCLKALEDQTYPKSSYEVIVVDNGSDEGIKELVSQFSQAVAAYESQPGSYCARNKGISLAKGSIFAFTDSDCIPASTWVEKGVNYLLKEPECGLVAGKIELFFKDAAQPTAVELYDSLMIGFNQEKFIKESKYGATANLFVWKDVMDRVGCFNQTLKSSGDREWGQRVFARGYKQIYADDVCVAHPARYSWDELCKKIIRIVGGHQDLKKSQGYLYIDFVRDLSKDFVPPLRSLFRIWLDERLKGNKQKFQYASVFLKVKYLRAWERIRLQLGGISTRG